VDFGYEGGATESGVSYTQRRVSVTLDRSKYPGGYSGESDASGSVSQKLREAQPRKHPQAPSRIRLR
jgi:hypothetical protein